MKVIFAIVLLGLASSTLAFYSVKKVPATIIDTSYLKTSNAVKKPSFAQLTTMMDQLRDTSAVTTFLDGLLEALANGRAEKLAIIEQTRAQCAEEEAFREEAVTEGERGANAAQNQLNLCNAQRDQANHLQELAASAVAVYENDLQELNDAREQQIRVFNDRTRKLEKLQENVQTLNQYLDAYEAEEAGSLNTAAFIQATNKLLKSTISTGHSKHVLPVFTKLLQFHARQSVNADDLAQIRQILNEVTQRAADSVQALAEQEAADEERYNNAEARLQGLLVRLNNQVAVTEAFAATMDACIAQESSILDLSNDKAQRNEDLLEAAEQLCSSAEEEWRLSEQSRTRQVTIINALLGAVNRIEADFEEERAVELFPDL